MPKPILLYLGLCVGLITNAQTAAKKSLIVPELDTEAQIDGTLNEPVWEEAARINSLDQYFPLAQSQPDYLGADIRIYYDSKGIFIGGKLEDTGAPILHQLIQRDQGGGNTDHIQFTLNPFNDGANDVNFYLSASGVQGDSKNTFDGEDEGWNEVWESAVVLEKNYWTFEIFIPYRALRIPKTPKGLEPKPWGFNVKRSRRSDRSMYSWNPIDRNFKNESLQSGLLYGIRVENPPVRISLRPNLTSTVQKQGNTVADQFAAGADVKLGLDKSFTLDMTLLPDFSQVAYDQQFVNFEPFEQRFDENRQFFKEGVNLFNKADLFYSRRIGGNPKNFTNANLGDLSNTTQSFTRMLNATKISGTTDRNLSVGVLNALTAANYALGTDSSGNEIQVLTEPLTNFNVFALDQRINGNSSIGLINSHVLRSNTEGATRDARVSALTANLNLLENSHFWNVALAQSQIYDISEPYKGSSLEWAAGKQTGAWRWEHELKVTTPEFDPNDLGFQRRSNRIHQDFSVSHQRLAPSKNYLRQRNTLTLQYRRLYDPAVFERVHLAYNHFALTSSFFAYGYDLEVRPAEYDFFDPRVWGRYRINPSSIWHNFFISMDYRKPVALDLGGGYWKWSQYEAGGFYGNVKLLVRVNDKFNFNASVAANNFNQLGWAQTLSTDSIGMAVRQTRNFTQSLEATYLLSSNAYWSLNLRHAWNRVDPLATYHLNENGTLSPSLAYSDRTLNINIFNADLKYVLWFAPGREMNLLYRASLVNAGSETDLAYWRNIQNFSSLAADHVISLRVVYFLDYAELLK